MVFSSLFKPESSLFIGSCAALETALNQALSLDSFSQEKLRALAHKVIAVQVTEPDFCLYFRLDSEQVSVLSIYDDEPDTRISGSAKDWLQLATAENPASSLINGNLTVAGDIETLMAVKEIVSQLDLDWETHLAELLGDVPAFFAGQLVQTAKDFTQQAHQSMLRNTDHFLHTASKFNNFNEPLPSKESVNQFYTDLRKLEMRLDRIAAKMQSLK